MLHQDEIRDLMALGSLKIEPYSPSQLRGPSYVLRLGDRFRRWSKVDQGLRLWSAESAKRALCQPEELRQICIEPSAFVLGQTLEELCVPINYVGIVSPLSHVARFGLGVTGGADLINPGHGSVKSWPLTLELKNNNVTSLHLDAGMPLARIRFVKLGNRNSEMVSPHGSIYDGIDPLCDPMLFEEWSVVEPFSAGD